MHNLKRNKLFLGFSIFFLSGCATSSYKIQSQMGSVVEIIATTDRILTQCEFQKDYSGDVKDPYGFMIHVLDEKNTVLSLTIEPVINQKECLKYQNSTEKILRRSKKVHLGGIGNIDGPREKTEFTHSFSNLGTYSGNGRVLSYVAVWNENGSCYDAKYGSSRPCPRDDFPMKESATVSK